MIMLMWIQWKHQCTFVFESLTTQSWIFYLIGCFFSGMIAAITIAAPAIKRKIMKNQSLSGSIIVRQVDTGKQDSNIFLALFYYLIYSSLHVLTMLLFMTYNGGVILTMLFFMVFSYFLFGTQDTYSDMPVNCCSSSA